MTEVLRREIESSFDLKIVDEQYYSWGESYWLQLDPNARKLQRTVSIVNIYPNTEQKTHAHPGYEEIIFGLDGESVHWCNGRKIVLRKGKVGYIPAGGEHCILNVSGEIARMMSIVYPTLPIDLGEPSGIDDIDLKEVSQLINLEAISDKFAKSVRLAVTLIDPNGKLLTSPKHFPDFCTLCLKRKKGDCILNTSCCTLDGGKALSVSHCVFGVYTIQSPIIINDRILGYLGCGYGRAIPPSADEQQDLETVFAANDLDFSRKAYRELEIINRNHLQSVAETLSLVGASLVQMIIHSAREQQISSYKLSLMEEKRRQAELETALSEARLKLLESQVNPHFLFNTLNTIAQMSMMEGAETAASLTYALANMLRRSLGDNQNLVTVSDEMTYIKDYLHIQQTRFPDRFEVEVDLSPDVMNVRVPFMMLMILVENAIQHGFKNIRQPGRLVISGRLAGDRAIIEVADNGAGVPENVVNSMKTLRNSGAGMTMHEGIGLKNIHRRLKHYYGDRSTFTIETGRGQGTKVIIEIPYSSDKGGELECIS
ncbi:MAG: histidine kinase [Negativicutes bacterium]|nr:histidine kinase [Negativicutes bacterium]MDR3591210.1 histidine kinase [Negativicutes bacterium]